jgi:cysteine desulfurase
MDDLLSKLDASVLAVVVEHVQNETGRIQDVSGIGAAVSSHAPDALVMVDTVQSVGKIAVPWRDSGMNVGFVGGHKIGAPCGGALIYRCPSTTLGAKFAEHLSRMREPAHAIGRPDPAVALTLVDAVMKEEGRLSEASSLSSMLRAELAKLAEEFGIDILFPVPQEASSPCIVSVLLPPYQGEILVRMLSDEGVMVSAGSACEAVSGKASRALLAMGVSDKLARTMLRISFSHSSTREDVNALLVALRKAIASY